MAKTPQAVAIEWATSLKDGDLDRLVALHDEHLVCALLGNTRVSGRYRGRDAFFSHTIKHVMGSMAKTDEVYLKDFRIACADEDHVVMQLHGGLPTQVGGRYDQNYLQLFKVENGLITETHELLDTVMLDTEVFGKKLRIPRTRVAEALAPASRFAEVTAVNSMAGSLRLERDFTAAMVRGDVEAALALLHPDAVLQVAGSTPVSGTIRRRDEIESRLAQYASEHFGTGSLSIAGAVRRVCSDENGFCWFANVQGLLKTGVPYAQTVGVVARVSGEAIAELYLYFDTAEEERQVFDNPLSGGTSDTGPEPFSIYSALAQ